MFRTVLALGCLGVVALTFTGCGGDSGAAGPNWGASVALTGRWVLTEESVDRVLQDIGSVVMQVGADGSYQRWEGSVDSWTKGIVLTSGARIQVQINEVHPAQTPLDSWEGTYGIAANQLRVTRKDNSHTCVEKYSRLQPSVPAAYVGNWLIVESTESGSPAAIEDVVVTNIGADGAYRVEERGSGVVETGGVEFSYRSEMVTTVQSNSGEPGENGRIAAATYTHTAGVVRLIDVEPPNDEAALAKEIGALGASARGSWLLTEVVEQGLRRDASLGAAGMRLEFADRSGSMVWWDPENATGQTANMAVTTYSGGYLVLQRTGGVWPSTAQVSSCQDLAASLAQVGSGDHYAGRYEVRSGQLWLGEGGLNPAYPLEAYATIWDKKNASIPGALQGTWSLQSRMVNGTPDMGPPLSIRIRGDHTATKTFGEGESALTQTGHLDTYASRAFVYHVISSGDPADIGTYFAAHYQVTGNQLTVIAVDGNGQGVVEVYRKS